MSHAQAQIVRLFHVCQHTGRFGQSKVGFHIPGHSTMALVTGKKYITLYNTCSGLAHWQLVGNSGPSVPGPWHPAPPTGVIDAALHIFLSRWQTVPE
jgi:hypothetical protein